MKSIAVDRLKVLSRMDAFETVDLLPDINVYGHWMAMALAAGPQLRVTFKIHFMPSTGAGLAHRALGLDRSQVTFQNTSDFMKEYCNMTLGLTKKVLADHGFRSAISLPFLTRGFDEVFFPESSGVVADRIFWKILFENESVACSAHIELFESGLDLSALPSAVAKEEDVGDVEFL